jgi:hypothetical protein
MAENLLKRNSGSIKSISKKPEESAELSITPDEPVIADIEPAEPAHLIASSPDIVQRRLYFINEIVEWELTQYIWTGCTKVPLRDSIMQNATELIRQIIRKQGLHTIYTGQEDSSFNDLLQTAWVQIERTLYKYRSCPHCRLCFNPDRPSDSILYQPGDLEYGIKTLDEVVAMCKSCPKCDTKLRATPVLGPRQGFYAGSETILFRGMSKVFNMWSQIARTVILAYIKKEGRDRKNSDSYVTHLGSKNRPLSDVMSRFLKELREINKYDANGLKIVDALEELVMNDDRPYDGLIGKLVNISGLSRAVVTTFLKMTKLRSFELSDSLLNRSLGDVRADTRKNNHNEYDDENMG